MPSTIARIIAGFLAGALAVLIFHEGMYVLMQQMGLPLRGSPWNMAKAPLWIELTRSLKMQPLTLPVIANQAVWGGMFGILFAFLVDRMPGGMTLVKGFLFACIFPMLLGSWLLIPMIKGGDLFAGAFAKGGFNYMALRNGFLLNGLAFGIGLGLLYPILVRAFRR